jgi:hypothetical protein
MATKEQNASSEEMDPCQVRLNALKVKLKGARLNTGPVSLRLTLLP